MICSGTLRSVWAKFQIPLIPLSARISTTSQAFGVVSGDGSVLEYKSTGVLDPHFGGREGIVDVVAEHQLGLDALFCQDLVNLIDDHHHEIAGAVGLAGLALAMVMGGIGHRDADRGKLEVLSDFLCDKFCVTAAIFRLRPAKIGEMGIVFVQTPDTIHHRQPGEQFRRNFLFFCRQCSWQKPYILTWDWLYYLC